LYTELDNTLYVYSLIGDHASPLGTYDLASKCCSGIITDNRLYLGTQKRLIVFEVTASLSQPLIRVDKIDTKENSCRILSVGNELILAEWNGCLEVFDIKSSNITHTL
jgi:hypothetical protein